MKRNDAGNHENPFPISVIGGELLMSSREGFGSAMPSYSILYFCFPSQVITASSVPGSKSGRAEMREGIEVVRWINGQELHVY